MEDREMFERKLADQLVAAQQAAHEAAYEHAEKVAKESAEEAYKKAYKANYVKAYMKAYQTDIEYALGLEKRPPRQPKSLIKQDLDVHSLLRNA